MIYLDNAATTYPKPQSVIFSADKALRNGANPGRSGHIMSINASERVYKCREKLAVFFSLKDEEKCILTPSCTIALNTVIYGVLEKGDHVVISSMEHNSVLRPIVNLANKEIITYSVADVFDGDDDSTVDSFRKAINKNTKLVVCTHGSNVFGIKLPVRRIAHLCRFYGVLFCLDAAQSAGVIPIDIEDIGADYVCVPGHKGLYGPMGTGALLINSDTIPKSLYQGGTGSSKTDYSQPSILPDKFESGTPNFSGIAGLEQGVDFVEKRGTKKILSHEISLIKYLYGNLKSNKNILLYTNEVDENRHLPLLSFNIKDMDCNTVSQLLSKNYGICVRSGFHCSPLAHKYMGTGEWGSVRVSPSVFSAKRDMDILINSIFAISKHKK